MSISVSILKGAAGSGKSSSIVRVFQELEKRKFRVIESYPRIQTAITHVLERNGIKVGVISMGDNIKEIEERFKWIKPFGCSVIICTSRPSGENVERTTKAVKKYFGADAEIFWTEKYPAARERLISKENQQSAESLLRKVSTRLKIKL